MVKPNSRAPLQLQHRRVFGQRLADQSIDAALPRQVCHQQVAQPVPFPVAAHRNGEFGGGVVWVIRVASPVTTSPSPAFRRRP